MVQCEVGVAYLGTGESCSHLLGVCLVIDLRAFYHLYVIYIHTTADRYIHQEYKNKIEQKQNRKEWKKKERVQHRFNQWPVNNNIKMGCRESHPITQPLQRNPQQQKYRQREDKNGEINEMAVHNQYHEQENNSRSRSKSEEKSVKDQELYFDQVSQTHRMKVNTLEVESVIRSNQKQCHEQKQQQPEEQSTEKQQQIVQEITDMSSFLRTVKRHFQTHPGYSSILSLPYLIQALVQSQHYHISLPHRVSLTSLLLSFLSDLHSLPSSAQSLPLIASFSASWAAIKHSLHEDNKNILRVMAYLSRRKEGEDGNWGHCYLDLEWKSSLEEYGKVAKIVRKMVVQNQDSFWFVSNYLVKCVQNMEKQGIPLQEIQNTVKEQLMKGSQEGNKAIAKDEAMEKHPNRKVVLPIKQKTYLNLKPQTDKQTQIAAFIKQQLVQASLTFPKFIKFVNSISPTFTLTLLQQNSSSIDLVKQKVIDLSFDKLTVDKYTEQCDDPTVKGFVQTQLKGVINQKKQIYNFIDGQLEFKVSCMATAKNVLNSIGQINEMADKIIQTVSNSDTTLVEVQNNLKGNKGVRSLILIVLIDKIRCEIHLLLRDKLQQAIFDNHLSQIRDSKKYSIITALHVLNDQLALTFLGRMKEIIRNNAKVGRSVKYGLGVSWQNVEAGFRELLKGVKIKVEEKVQDGIFYRELKNRYEQIIANNKELGFEEDELTKIANNIAYKSSLKDSKSVEHQSLSFLTLFQSTHPHLLRKADSSPSSLSQPQLTLLKTYTSVLKNTAAALISRQKYSKAIQILGIYTKVLKIVDEQLPQMVSAKRQIARCQCVSFEYNRALSVLSECLAQLEKNHQLVLERVQVLTQMAEIYTAQGNTFKPLQLLNQTIQIIYQAHLSQPKLQSQIFLKIGLIFTKSNDHEQSLLYLQKSLTTIEKYAGKSTMQSVGVIMEIAAVYREEKEWELALEEIGKCAEIVGRTRGEDSLEMAEVLNKQGEIYTAMEKYSQAEKTYISVLRIVEEKKGKNSQQYGACSFNLGQTYLSLNNPQLSLKHLFKSLALTEKTHGKETVHSGPTIQLIAKCYNRLMNYREEEHYLHKLGNTLQKEKDREGGSHLHTFGNIAKKAANRGNYIVGEKYYRKGLEIVEQSKGKDSFQSVEIRKQIGAILKYQQNYKAAQEEYQKCIKILQTTKGANHIDRAELDCQLGHLLFLQQQYSSAEEHYLQAYDLCVRFKVKYWVFGLCCYRLGVLYEKQFKLERALTMYREGLPVYREMRAKEEVQIRVKIQRIEKEMFPCES